MNKNVKRRDEILFGNYDPERYRLGGCARCDLTYEQVKMLVDEGFLELDECQNESPTTKDFLNALDGFDEDVDFEAYAIGPERGDYRVTIEGINMYIPINKPNEFCRFVEEFHWADEFNVNSDGDGFTLRAWWD